jgi:hypothetical protein
MPRKKRLALRQIVDDDTPWVEYPLDIALQCGVLKKNPRKGEFIYVPGEDNHTILEASLEKLGFTPRYTQYWVPKLSRWLKSDQWPNAWEWAGGLWPEGSAWRRYQTEPMEGTNGKERSLD